MKISLHLHSCFGSTVFKPNYQRDEPPDLLALLSPNFKPIIPNAPASTAAMDPLPSVDRCVYDQRISERPSAQEESQVSDAREERQRRQEDLY